MSLQNSDNPFIGLRPFESSESLLFFGRDEQTMELLQRLHQHHFVAIVGGSGSGKSSLIRAGLIPRLKAGYLVEERDRWMVSIMKPGESPLYNLAFSINEETGIGIDGLTRDMKEKGVDGILNSLKTVLKENTNLFLLVDQFEELFRFSIDKANTQNKDEAIEFVNILLGLVNQRELPVYIVITMRSDFIGDCAQFFGLPEAMNQSQYLVPRLTRNQLKNVIEGPVKLYGRKINPALTSRLLNDIQTVQDELPLLQHVLMRTWDYEMLNDRDGEMNINDYLQTGGISEALSNHADEAMKDMNDADKAITIKIFQALTAIDENGRKIRRPARLSELMSITGSKKEYILSIINRFIEDKRSFLIVSDIVNENDKIIDISHESLIRQWKTLNTWVDAEADSSRNYLQLVQSAELFRKRKKDLLKGSELFQLQQWFNTAKPGEVWAKRYSPDFEAAKKYLLDSEKEWNEEIKRKKTRKKQGNVILLGLLVLAVTSFYFILQNRTVNKKNDEISKKNDEVIKYASSADSAAAVAITKTKIALEEKLKADSAWEKLKKEKNRTDSALKKVWIEKKRADSALLLANLYLEQVKAQQIVLDKQAAERREQLVQEAAKQKNNSESYKLVIEADKWKIKDPTEALRLAEAAVKINPDPFITLALSKIYLENNFYKIVGRLTSNISSVAFSPDGKYMITGSEDNKARLWDLQGNILEFKGHKAVLRSVAFSPDEKHILTGSDDGTAKLWDLKGNATQEFKIGHPIRSVAFSPDGKNILTGSEDDTVRLWDLDGNILKKLNKHKDVVNSVCFSPDGKYMLTGSYDKTAILWNMKGDTVHVFRGHDNGIRAVAFSPDGKNILTGSEDKTARLWDLDGELIQEFKGHKSGIRSLAFSPDGKNIITGSQDNEIRFWDLDGNTIQEFKGHTDHVRSVAFSPDGRSILSGSSDKTLRIWYLKEKGVLYKELGPHDNYVRSVAFSADGKYILTGSEDNKARLWNLKGEFIRQFEDHSAIRAVAFSPDGKYILTGSNDKTAKLWNLDGKIVQVFKGHTDTVRTVAFSPDGKYILTGSYDNMARLWDLQGNTIHIFKGHKNFVRGVTFSPDGKYILTASFDKTVKLWDINGKLIRTFTGHKGLVRAVAFSPDGNYILSGSNDKTARLWDLNGKVIQVFKEHTGFVRSVAFSPDGKYIITGSEDKTIKLWDLSGRVIQDFEGHAERVRSVAFSPDGRYIVSGSDDKTARIWYSNLLSEDFLNSGKIEQLSPDQKTQFGIK